MTWAGEARSSSPSRSWRPPSALYRELVAENAELLLAFGHRAGGAPAPPGEQITHLLSFDPATVKAVRLRRGDQEWRARAHATAGWSGVERSSDIDDFLTNMLELAEVMPLEVAPDELAAITGSTPPQGVVELEREGQPPVVLLLGRRNPPATGVYAQIGPGGRVVLTGALAMWEFDKVVRALSPTAARSELDRVAVGIEHPELIAARIEDLQTGRRDLAPRRVEVVDLDGEVRPARIDRHAERIALDQVQLAGADAVPATGHAEVGPFDGVEAEQSLVELPRALDVGDADRRMVQLDRLHGGATVVERSGGRQLEVDVSDVLTCGGAEVRKLRCVGNESPRKESLRPASHLPGDQLSSAPPHLRTFISTLDLVSLPP